MLYTTDSIDSHRCNEIEGGERHACHRVTEIQNDLWFQVETCSQTNGLPAITTHILSDLNDALALVSSLNSNEWTDLRVYVRQSKVSQKEFILEPIQKVFATQEGAHLFVLKSGVVVYEPNNGAAPIISVVSAQEIYSKSPGS